MLDLAVPRDIEPQVASLQDIYLYSVDDLQHVVDQNRALRESERVKAEAIIDSGFGQYLDWKNTRKASDLVARYRRSVDEIAARELILAKKQLLSSDDPEQVIEDLVRALSRKIMHGPTVALRDAASREDRDYLDVARSLLGVADEDLPNDTIEGSSNE